MYTSIVLLKVIDESNINEFIIHSNEIHITDKKTKNLIFTHFSNGENANIIFTYLY